MPRSPLWRHNPDGRQALTGRRVFARVFLRQPKEYFYMSRITRALVLSSVAATAVAGATGIAAASSGADGAAANSPGVVSGNVIQVPIHLPVNVCGNTVNVIGLLNPAFGNTCLNG